MRCACGAPDCLLLDLGYPYCWGCGDHHREPVATPPEALCPVDLMTWDWCRECDDYRSNGECPHGGYARASATIARRP